MSQTYRLLRRPTAINLRDLGFVPSYEIPDYDGPPKGDTVEEWVMRSNVEFLPCDSVVRVEPVTCTDDDDRSCQYVEGGVPCHRYDVRIPCCNGGEYQPLGWYEFDGTGTLGFIGACYSVMRKAEFDAFLGN